MGHIFAYRGVANTRRILLALKPLYINTRKNITIPMAKVKVSQGWLEGELKELVTRDGQYFSFKGIPYAAPPVGKLRFKAPQPPLPWDGVRPAKAHGSQCMQYDIFTDQLLPGSEDCLFLNVYTHDIKPKKLLPVMVFIHGGGFKSGAGDESHYGPDFLVEHEVVLVTINYRLEALGFLCLNTEDVPGNAGLKDQVAALRWVKENIKNFGGDSDNVTIFGESAGGASVIYHILSPMSKGLFKRAISMSGVPCCDWCYPFKPRERALVLTKQLGKETNDPKEALEFLQSVPVEKLINTNPTVLTFEELTNNIAKMYHFAPVVEKDFGKEQFLTESPFEVLKKGKLNEVDLLIGHTDHEALVLAERIVEFMKPYNRFPELLVPRQILCQTSPDVVFEEAKRIHKYYFGEKTLSENTIKEFANFMTESCFVYHIHRFVNRIPKTGDKKRFFYVFSCLSGRNVHGNAGGKFDMYGASHLDDLHYLFDAKFFNMKIDKESREYKLVQLVCTTFTNFAKYGNPTPDKTLGVTWPEYDPSSKHYVEIGDQLTVGTNYKSGVHKFWKTVFERTGIEY